MKPTTKLQRHIVELSDKLRPITKREMLFGRCVFECTGDQYGSLCTCHECGHQWRRATNIAVEHLIDTEACWHAAYSMSTPEKEYDKCPNCKKELTITHKCFNKSERRDGFGVIDYIDGYHVVRTFLIRKNIVRKQPAEFTVYAEVCRKFLEWNGNHEFAIACSRSTMYGQWADQWTIYKGMSLKSTRPNSYYRSYYGDPYDVDVECIVRKLHPDLNMIKWHNTRRSPESALRMFADPHALTIFEAGLYELFAQYGKDPIMSWPTMKICLRNHYDPSDGKMYRDYLNDLEELGKDLHNAHYVCPADLEKAHAKYRKKVERKAELERAEKEKEKIIQAEAAYDELIRKYINIVLTADNLSVAPIPSVRDVYEEGCAMHHCVYDRGYYEEEDTLLLSARDGNGNRLATIEYNTEQYKIMQCRAACNQRPERYDEICFLINSNKELFIKASTGKKLKAVC